ncbi:CHAT domain-containing protein [Okeanomitos corallinicola TIOX110]|uniref:CHAT domain-containing protein n=1 Tax=Okeanomitos corallinicola TIOX110 TaxID=3133117 RepID=A0ABZ2UME1_9CYAN
MSKELANAQTTETTETPNNTIPGTETPNTNIVEPGIETPDPGNPFNSCIFGCQQIPGSETKIINPNLSILNPNPTPELKFTYSFLSQLNLPIREEVNVNIFQARNVAQRIEQATGVKPAFIYISFVPVEILPDSVSGTNKQDAKNIPEKNTDEIEIILVTGKGNPVLYRIPNVTKGNILTVIDDFRTQIVAPQYRNRNSYLKPAQQLHKWLIKPIESDLQKYEINNLVFLLDAGLRSTPMAALHDGKQFLVEKYSIGLMPSLTLTNTLYTDIKKSEILAMGISQSTQGQEPLPAVPIELRTLVTKLWSGKLLLNEQTTVENLKSLRRQKPFGIVHLATHANFTGGAVENSYIQLWENKLRLNQIRQLGLHEPQVEMLVISACRSALGNEEAEIGFAGLAVLAGVKTSVASLWSVDDTGTAALMTKFYESLKTAPIRADALRQAQIAMATGKVYLENGQLQGIKEIGSLPLPEESIQEPNQSLSHPYFWSGFTMVGNPW